MASRPAALAGTGAPAHSGAPAGTKSSPISVAVVGSGVAGLTAAHALSKSFDGDLETRRFRVTIIEAAPTVGMDAHSVDAYGARSDVPLRVFSRAYYPNLCRLYDDAGVPWHQADYAFSCSDVVDGKAQDAYFAFRNVMRWGRSVPLPALKLLVSREYWHLLSSMLRFFAAAPAALASGELEGITLEQWMEREGYSRDFRDKLLYPMLSVVCTCTYDAVASYPADVAVDYLASQHGIASSQCRAYGGTRDVVARLTAGVDEILTNCPVEAVCPADGGSGVDITFKDRDNGSSLVTRRFDRVVLATQANTSLGMLQGVSRKLTDALAAVPYEARTVLVHTDESLLPPSRVDWRPLNIFRRLSPDADDACSVSVWLNKVDWMLESELERPVFQTWNPWKKAAPGTVIAEGVFQRPLVTPASRAMAAALEKAQGEHGIHICGAYVLYSMPLLENGVRSGLKAARRLGAKLDWGCECTALTCECEDVRTCAETADDREQRAATWRLTLFAAVAIGMGLFARSTWRGSSK